MNTHIDLVGLIEIADRAGVTSQQVEDWIDERSFPEPTAELAEGPFWVWGPVHLWLRQHDHRSDADLPS